MLYIEGMVKNMKPFTTNFALKDSLDSRKEPTDFKSDVLPKEIQDKLKLIEKVFK